MTKERVSMTKLRLADSLANLNKQKEKMLQSYNIILSDKNSLLLSINDVKKQIWAKIVKSAGSSKELIDALSFLHKSNVHQWVSNIEDKISFKKENLSLINSEELISRGSIIKKTLDLKDSTENNLKIHIEELKMQTLNFMVIDWANKVIEDFETSESYFNYLNKSDLYSAFSEKSQLARRMLIQIKGIMKKQHPEWNFKIEKIDPELIIEQQEQNDQDIIKKELELKNWYNTVKQIEQEMISIIDKIEEHNVTTKYLQLNDNDIFRFKEIKSNFDKTLIDPSDIIRYSHTFNDNVASDKYQLDYVKLNIANKVLGELKSDLDKLPYLEKRIKNKRDSLKYKNVRIYEDFDGEALDKTVSGIIRLFSLKYTWYELNSKFILNYEWNNSKGKCTTKCASDDIMTKILFSNKLDQSGSLIMFFEEMREIQRKENKMSIAIENLSFIDLRYIYNGTFNINHFKPSHPYLYLQDNLLSMIP